ncbi:MAG: DUF4118 domain-containing protein [Actinomycetia bacterium]|nr:DUF4118 domain-containing protein [Actinomycetes bacterium]
MGQGRLRIYLGAAPGVGKTVAMLGEGHRRLARGTDVVVGVCETHDRAFTQSLLEGLEVVPRRRLDYRGTVQEEMDVDAILDRRPAVVLVDELAHTNVPGSRHEKRYEDVQELLDAGIDVISTVNIQHLESLNDAVTAITGIVQRETVPDEIVRAADQIDLVDMSPDALRRRMSHGHIYSADRIDAALANYFRPGNLSALRELALLWMADKVDAGLEDYRAAHAIAGPWPVRERVVVALSGAPGGEALLRRGARIASRLAGGEMIAAYVTRSDGLTTAPVGTVAKLQHVTTELGGEFHTVSGDDPTRALLDFAHAVNATQILVAAGGRGWWQGFAQSFARQIIAEAGDIDVHVVNNPSAGVGFHRRRLAGLPARRLWAGVVSAIVMPVVLTFLLHLVRDTFSLTTDIPIYLLGVVVVALVGGVVPALVAAVVSSLLLNWFFLAPLGALKVYNPDNVVAMVVFVLVGVLVSTIVTTNARQAEQASAAQRESAALAELSHSLLGTTEQLPLLLHRASDRFGATGAALVRRAASGAAPEVVASVGDFDPSAPGDRERVDERCDLILQPPGVTTASRRLFAACAAHASAIVQREALAKAAAETDDVVRDNAAKTALLSAVSHDLRTPLSAIKAAIGSLRETDVTWSKADQDELEEVIEESADRLATLIGNLLHLSRLQVGGVVAHPAQVDLRDVLPAAVDELAKPSRVTWSVDPDACFAVVDLGLLDRVLGNVLENAVRHQPPDTPVTVTASRVVDRVEIRVIDMGPGVPDTDLERIFEPFQQTGDVPDGAGLGLGLAVTRGLAEAMGGRVTAEATPGGGLTLVVALPTRLGQALGGEG